MTQPSGTLFEQLLGIMARLRGADGCPWDREQTRASLKPFLIEEAYEVLEAIDGGDDAALAEELGDLLFQVVFHAQIGVEDRAFDMADILQRLCDKMTSRHPHVFGEIRVDSAQAALSQWEATSSARAPPRAGSGRCWMVCRWRCPA
jgi:tetrapyrrole methylase family protein/MazG family protein